MTDAATLTTDPWDEVVGQDRAVAMLRSAAAAPAHAWLFLGPSGSGKRAAARAFAGDLLAAGHDASEAARIRALAADEQHPDLHVIERVGAAISADQADDIVREASRSAVEGDRKVLLLDEFHLVQPEVAPKLLKSIEEPPPGTIFLVLADEIPPELVTIASRCVRVDFTPVPEALITARLEAEGASREAAEEAARSAHGDLRRARLLAGDERLALRLALWRDIPRRLDGTGARATVLVAEVRATIDDAGAPLAERHEEEVADLQERIERYGQRGSGAKELEARHKREARRLRTDELRLGLGQLARSYRDELAVSADPSGALRAIAAIQAVSELLIRNPNEELLLTNLFLDLPSLH